MGKDFGNVKAVTLKGGVQRWTARVKMGGREVQKTFDYKRDAVAWKRSMEADKRRKSPVDGELHKSTFNDIFDWAKSDPNVALAPSTAHNLPRLSRVMGTLEIGKVTQKTLDERVNELRRSTKDDGSVIAPDTFRRAYCALRVVVKEWSAHHAYSLPCDFNHKLPAPWARVRSQRISDEEVALLKAAVPFSVRNRVDVWPLAIDFLLNTGLRRQELVLAEWTDVRAGSLVLYAERTKTRVDRYVPLNATALAVLAALPRTGARIFGFPSLQAMSRQLDQIAATAELPHVTAHLFRHEFASRMVEQTNYSHAQIMQITGHKTFSTYRRYYNLRPDRVCPGFENISLCQQNP